jgi:subtilase family serine protease
MLKSGGFQSAGINKSMLSPCYAKISQLFSIITFAALISGSPTALAAPHSDDWSRTVPKVRVTELIDDNDRVNLPGSRNPATLDKEVSDLGLADDTLYLGKMILSLKPDTSQEAALDSFLRTVHDPASPNYGKWLTPQSFEQHFGASVKDIEAIKKWLTGNGFSIDEVPAGGRSIVFSGNVAGVRKAFKTDIHNYTRNGEAHIANATEAQIPRALSNVVGGVVSLHDFRSKPLHARATVNPAYTANATTHYLAPADFSVIYNLNPLYSQTTPIKGSGRTIAILGRSNVALADISTFRSAMNLPVNAPQIIFNGTNPGYVTGDESESDLDLEWAGAVAPAATIKLVTTASTATTDGIDTSASYAVTKNVADIISVSYGACESSMTAAGVNFYNGLWKQADAQGITVLVSSGDSGVAGCDSPTATTAAGGTGINGLCSSPYSTCVGGTQFADTANPALYWAASNTLAGQGSVLSYIPEVVWNESASNGGTALWATGGGASIIFTKPVWQTVAGVPADGKRDVPDVALSAAQHDGYLVYTSDTTNRAQILGLMSGTSAAAPSFAGIMALVNQKTGARQGSANAKLYGLGAIQANGSSRAYFHSITSGNNSVPGQAGFAATTAAYNLATGLGSIDGNVLVTHWLDKSSSVTVSSSAPSIATGQGVTLTATVSGTSPTGTVQFMDGTANLGALITINAGVAVLSTNLLASVGAHSISAVYSGDGTNAPSTSAALVQTVTKASSAVGIATSAPSVSYGQSVTLTATVTGSAPTGGVQFIDGVTNLDTAVTLNNGVATLTTLTLSQGSHSITATYTGDTNNLGSTSAALSQTVTAAVVVGSTGGDGDVPTLPEWGEIILALLLMLVMWRNGARRV